MPSPSQFDQWLASSTTCPGASSVSRVQLASHFAVAPSCGQSAIYATVLDLFLSHVFLCVHAASPRNIGLASLRTPVIPFPRRNHVFRWPTQQWQEERCHYRRRRRRHGKGLASTSLRLLTSFRPAPPRSPNIPTSSKLPSSSGCQ